MAIRRFIDIGANLTDPVYHGIYHGTKKHEPDIRAVLERSWSIGMDRIIVTGGSLKDSEKALELVKMDKRLFVTVGCHPTRCDEFEETDPETYYNSLLDLINCNRDKVVAVGECGLDYDRTQFCKKETQQKYFKKQLKLSQQTGLPLFLHCRNAANDLLSIMSEFDKLPGGVVHSFDGSSEDALRILEMGFYIGINGCSLKTENNLNVAKEIDVNKLLLETDSPWCEIRPSHAGFKYIKTTFPSVKKEKWKEGCMVKSRNEPACIVQIAEILSEIKNEDIDSLINKVYNNSISLFFNETKN